MGRRAQNTGRGHAKVAKLHEQDSFSVSFNRDLQAQLQAFSDNFVNDVLRPAAYAAATVLYDEMRLRVPEKTGALKASIYRWREKQDNNRAIFYVGVNKRKAPHWHLIEYGHYQIYRVYWNAEVQDWRTIRQLLPTPIFSPARPYVRPTFDAKYKTAIDTAMRVVEEKVNGRGGINDK